MKFKENDQVRHIKTGVVYTIIGVPDKFRIEKNNQPAYLYQKNRLSAIWVRPQAEMEDGRFELVEQF